MKGENGKLKVADELYIISIPLSLVLYARISIAACGKYHAERHITCAVGANIERAERAYPKGGWKEKCLSFSCRSFFCAVFYVRCLRQTKNQSIHFSEIIIFAEQKQPFFMFAVCDKRKIEADSFRR